MGIFAKLFGRKDDDKKVGGMEDYMTLVRVYFQAALASQLGITNLAMLPDLRVFKTSLHVPTVIWSFLESCSIDAKYTIRV